MDDEFHQALDRIPVKGVVKKLVEILAPRGPDGTRKILDIGASYGRHTRYLAERGFHVTAVDNSREAFSRLETLARKARMQIRPVFADITQINGLPADAFNAVVCTYVIQDLSPPQTVALAEYIKEHTKPGGYFALAAFLGRYRSLLESLRPRFTDWPVVTPPTKGKTHTICCGPYETIEMLLQKPTDK